jgi:hypothetical protein
MAKNDKYTTEQVIAALHKTRGMVYLAADELHCSPKTVYNYINRYAAVRTVVAHEDGRVDDTAELGLASAILRGEPWAITFRLKTKGKGRGYVERNEIVFPDIQQMTDEQLAAYIATGVRTLGVRDGAGKAAGREDTGAGTDTAIP